MTSAREEALQQQELDLDAIPAALFETPPSVPPEHVRLSGAEIERIVIGNAVFVSHSLVERDGDQLPLARFLPDGVYKRRPRDNRIRFETVSHYRVHRDAIVVANFTTDGRGGHVLLFFRDDSGTLGLIRSRSLGIPAPEGIVPAPVRLEPI